MFTSEIDAALAHLQKDLFKLDEALNHLKKCKRSTSLKMVNKMENMENNQFNNLQQINSQLQRTPIAIIGMASIFPESRNLQEYWETIFRKKDCITDVPASRWDVDTYYDPDPRAPDKTYCKRGGFIPDIEFNPKEFGLPPNILEVTDVSQMLALVVAKAAMEDAGYGESRQFSREKVGVVLGVALARQLSMPLASRLEYPVWEKVLKSSGLSDEDTQKIIEKIKSNYIQWEENAFPGMLANVVAGRIANRLDLGGMNCVVDAACASSLGALKMAISELLEYRSDMMMTGGVDTDNSIVAYMCFSKTPAVSKGDKVRPFDAESDGMMLGEGIGMIILKRLADAERDGDRIYAVIKGIGTSSDGRYKSIYAPRSEGQIQALRRAYADAGISPKTVGLIEAHGTGTMAGDPAEVTALKEFFSQGNQRQQHIALGSVKSQIGHTKATAGAASLIKTALALHHKVLPPTINVTSPHPKLQLETSPFYLSTETRPWIRSQPDVPRRAGVSSFGFGGTNYHVVLEEYQGEHQQPYRLHHCGQPILVWAATPEQLVARCTELLQQLQSEAGEPIFQELVSTSKTAEIAAGFARIGFVADSLTQACQFLQSGSDYLKKSLAAESWDHPLGIFYHQTGVATQGKVVALFSGQGSQYLEMGKELAMNFPVLRQTYSTMDGLLSQDGLQPISATVFPPPSFDPDWTKSQAAALQATQYAQPAIGVFSTSLYKIFQQAGFQADFVAGHSFGELTALWASGVLSDQDYFFLVKSRGQAMTTPNQPDVDTGAMLAVQGDVSQIPTMIKDFSRVKVANWNSPRQVVLAGAKSEIIQLQEILSHQTFVDQGLSVVLLPVASAFHTPLVAHAQQPFAQAVAQVDFQTAKIPVYSNVTCKPYPPEPKAMQEMLKQHLLNSVQFKDEIEAIYKDGGRVFVEFGPRNILTNLIKEILGDRPHIAVALNPSRQKDSDRQLREAFVKLRVAGMALGDLDPYQFEFTAPQPQASPVNVRLSGNNYVSEKTKQAFTQALQNGHTVQLSSATLVAPTGASPVSSSVNSPVNPPVNSPVNVSPVTAVTTALPPMTQPTAIQPSQPEPSQDIQTKEVQVKEVQVKRDMSHYRQILDSIETTLAHFHQHQEQVLQVHEQALQHQTEYAKSFCQLMHQQYSLFGNEQFKHPDSETQRAIIHSSERNMMRFHDHQSETLNIHGQFLNHEAEYNQHFFHLVKQQYGALLSDSGRKLSAAEVEQCTVDVDVNVDEDVVSNGLQTNGYQPNSQAVNNSASGSDSYASNGYSNGSNGYSNGSNGHQFKHSLDYQTISSQPLTSQPTPSTPVPSVTPVASVAPPAVAIPTASPPAAPFAAPAVDVDLEQLSQVLLNIVSEKTGYPVEMLELPMDMESELGIDSIKRVEILGALLELYPGLPQPDPEQLGVLRTLGEVAEYMLNQVQQLDPSDSHPPRVELVENPPATTNATVAAPPLTTTTAPTPAPTPAPITVSTAQDNQYPRQTPIERSLVMITSEKTGYPPEALGLGMDLTSELGIDTVKLTEIVTSLLEQYPDLTRPDPARLAELSTLGHILELVQAPDPVPAEKKNLQTAAYSQSCELEDSMLERLRHSLIQRSPVRLKALPQPDALDFDLPPQTVVLLTDDGTPTTVKLAEALHQRGWPVVVLSFPTDLISALPTSPSLPEGVSRVQLRALSESHLQEQLAAITARYGAIGAFIHLHPASPETEPLYREQDAVLLKHVFLWAKHLKGELEQTTPQGRCCFLTVARLDGALGLGQQRFGAVAAGLFGLTKTLAQEWPNVFCRAIDLHPDLGVDASVSAILAELHDPNRLIREVGYSVSLQRSTLVCEPAELLAMGQHLVTHPQNIHQNSVFLVSGGGKGITAQCAIAIAQRYHCNFILVGRSSIAEPEPAWATGYDNEADLKKQIVAQLSLGGQKVTPMMVQQQFNAIASRREISQTLTAIQNAGGKVAYVNVDITDAAALQTQLAPVIARLGPVTGIIHGAGNLADKRIEKKTEQDYEKVYAAKVRGLEHLLACINPSQLDALVLFSSVVGFYGNVGQSDYAMANEILNKSAHLLQQQLPNCHVVAINWGPWDSGMVSPELKKAFAERNIFTIPTEIGAAFLLREMMATDQPVAQVVIGSPLIYVPDTIPLSLNRYRIRRHLTVEANPFLLDHVIAGRPVLPATCALAWMINICEQLYPGYQIYQCQNYKVLKGITFDDNYTPDYILDLQEVHKSETGKIEFLAKICSESEGKLRYHFSGQLLLSKTPPTPSRYQPVDLSLDQSFPVNSEFYQKGEGSLFHGPIFQGVKRVFQISPQKLTMEVNLPSLTEQQQGQFPLQTTNPYIADVQIHAHWIWSQFYYQQACLPAEIECYEQFSPVPFDQTIYISAEIKSKTNTGMVADVIAHDREGYIYNRMMGAKGTILPLNLDQKSFVKDVVTRRLHPSAPVQPLTQPPAQVPAPASH